MTTLLSDAWHLVLAAKANGRHHLDDQELASIRANYRAIIDGSRGQPPASAYWSTGQTETIKGAQLAGPT